MTNAYPGVGKINYGRDHNYYKEVIVSAAGFGAGSVDGYQPDGIINFSTQYITFSIAGTTAKVVEGSFNGTSVHFKLDAGDTAFKTIAMPYRVVSKYWFRVVGGGSATVVVQAW